MIETKSLKQKVSEISIYSFLCMTVIMFTCFMLYSMKKNKITEAQIKSELSLNIKNQTNQFLPSYLLPEQKQGVGLILSKIKTDEGLEDIRIIHSQSEIPSNYENCRPSDKINVVCPSNDLSLTAVIAPLQDSNNVYGYIFKSKKNASAANLEGAIQFAGVALLIIGIAFMAIYLRLTRLISKTLPNSMDQLVQWIESEIEGKQIECVQLQFKELEDLKVKISEVIERANKSRDQAVIGQVTSGIMHDIKTPLQSIVTAVHLVSEQKENSAKRLMRLENLFTMCLSNIPFIGEVIETTLDGNRQIQIEKSKSNMRETIEASLKHTQELSRLRNVTVEVNAPHEVMASFDSLQFIRVVNNLLKNGIEAAAESEATLGRKVKVSLASYDNHIKLTIEDSGSGFKVSPHKAFRAFRTTKTRGTGLGLLISKKIVEAHNGMIVASNGSEFGGAKMEILLPA
ncbi:MAG TPA: HAMP domain-containing sensor histidine kinase [Bacteriovoracaceae bacterium]|nr:HAMP domain-containing sensor histidine kinase [Bacteriovoracaceae bacterium]